ncbi:MAG: RusA family crossover junction endodeoxyribonuclease [bacterium]|nr:RusA family crossover junction endodeoxyribonuclease [bacterium]
MAKPYIFKVKGLPPIKKSEKSMWATNVEQIKALKNAAKNAYAGPLLQRVKLKVTIFINEQDKQGDLDNMISGICDALQEPHKNVTPKTRKKYSVDELKPVFYKDDSQIINIEAVIKSTDEKPHYIVTVSV